ncbi:MAG: hypothetical protein AAFY71_28620 [Bacteroidota bacterium]
MNNMIKLILISMTLFCGCGSPDHTTSHSTDEQKTETQESSCDCGYRKVLFEGKYGSYPSILVCGTILEEDAYKGFSKVNELSILDCTSEEHLMDFEGDEITEHLVKVDKQVHVISLTYMIVDEEWNLGSQPLIGRTLIPDPDSLHMGNRRLMLAPPPAMSVYQRDSIQRLALQLWNEFEEKQTLTIPDELAIYQLFLGAVNGMDEAKKVLQQAYERDDYDGAISETLAEIPFSILEEN